MTDLCERLERVGNAVVVQVWADAIGGQVGYRRTEQIAREAWLFLTAEAGQWAEARRNWCGLLGRCPDELRRRALRHQAEHRATLAEIRAKLDVFNAGVMKRSAEKRDGSYVPGRRFGARAA